MPRSSLFHKISLWPVSAWLIAFGGVPTLLVFAASFMRRGVSDFLEPAPSLEGYAHIMTPVFLKVLLNSLYLAGGAALACLLVGYPFAYALARYGGRYKNLLLLLVVIPFWTNSLIRTYALVFILRTKGVLNWLLLSTGIIDRPLSLMYTDFAVFTGLTYTLLPFMILPLYGSIEKLDPKLLEASRDLGAGSLRTFLRITLPLTMPGVVAGCMLVFLPALGMFYIPDLLGGAKSVLLGNYIKNQFLTFRNWPAGSAAGVLLTLLMVLLIAARSLAARTPRGKRNRALEEL